MLRCRFGAIARPSPPSEETQRLLEEEEEEEEEYSCSCSRSRSWLKELEQEQKEPYKEDEAEEEEEEHPSGFIPLTQPHHLLGLICLDLPICRIRHLPDAIADLYNLEELRLPYNGLRSLPNTIHKFPNLKILDVQNNMLQSLPNELPRSLVELDLSRNNLRLLGDAFESGMPNLQKLRISGNPMSYLPAAVSGMPSLRLLDARYCELGFRSGPWVYLAEGTASFPNLRDLDLRDNCIRELPPSFGQLHALKSLELEGNLALKVPPMEIANQGVDAVEYMNARVWKTAVGLYCLYEEHHVMDQRMEGR